MWATINPSTCPTWARKLAVGDPGLLAMAYIGNMEGGWGKKKKERGAGL